MQNAEECKRDASGFLGQLGKLDACTMLSNVEHHSQKDPKNKISISEKVLALNTAVELLQSLKIFIGDLRDGIEEKRMVKFERTFMIKKQVSFERYPDISMK